MNELAKYLVTVHVPFTYTANPDKITFSPDGIPADIMSNINITINQQSLNDMVVVTP